MLVLGVILLGRARNIPKEAMLPPRGMPVEPLTRGEI
jgi:hypothetical protein